MKNVKIIIGGDSGVGKTRLFKGLFSMPLSDLSLYEPTYEAFMNPLLLEEGITIDIWDVPGTIDLTKKNVYFNNLGGAILVFDITRITTFDSINTWLSRIWQDSPGIPVVLVANKIDLLDTSHDGKTITLQAERLTTTINANTQFFCQLIQTSASKSKNSYRVFSKLLSAIKLPHKQSIAPKLPINDMPPESLSDFNYFNTRSLDTSNAQLEDETTLPDLENLISRLSQNSKLPEVAVQKITHFLKNNRDIRKTFSWLPVDAVPEMIDVARSSSDWLIESNFFYLLIYKGIEYLIRVELSLIPKLASVWAQKLTNKFIEDIKTWDMFTDLKKDSAKNLISKFISNPQMELDMEIYSVYRSAVYSSN